MSEVMDRLIDQREQAEALVERFRGRVMETQSLTMSAQEVLDAAQAMLNDAKACEREAVDNLLKAQALLVTVLDDIRVERMLFG